MNETEKRKIEKATAEGFLTLYNKKMGTSYKIVEHSDSPDIRCLDSNDNELKLELLMTEDRPDDIKAALGRSNHRSLEALGAHLKRVEAGQESVFERVSCLEGNVSTMLVGRIQAKLKKDYGPNTALVIRDTSGVDWDWDFVMDDIKSQLNLSRNPYDKGIWIISRFRDRLFHII